MTSDQEITIPKSPGNTIVLFVINIIVVLSVCLAVVNFFNRVAMIASFIWLAFMTMSLWTPVKKAGSFHRFLTDCLGDLLGRDFAEVTSPNVQTKEIRFGYELFGHRFIQRTFTIDKIESDEQTRHHPENRRPAHGRNWVYFRAAQFSRAEATHESSKAESKYDTRGLEASYLARGQSKQAAELEAAIAEFEKLPAKKFAAGEPIGLGALVELETRRRKRHLFHRPARRRHRNFARPQGNPRHHPAIAAGRAAPGQKIRSTFSAPLPLGNPSAARNRN
jgi:hypothetical protein